MEITVVYPAYNEEENIRSTVERSLEALREQFEDFEILIVDDRGQDNTGAIADELARQHPEVRVLRNPRNLGQGESLKNGFREARGDLVIHNAMDYPFDLRDLAAMLPLLDDADVVAAARRMRAGYTLYRRVLSVGNLALLHVLFPLRLSDYNFVQLYRREVLQRVKTRARSTAFITPETMIRAHDMGFRVREVAIEYHPRLRGVATAGKPKVVLSSMWDMLRFWLERTVRRDPKARAENREGTSE